MQAHEQITLVNNFAERLKRLREAANLTQGELAARAGVSQGTIGNLETGMRKHPRALVAIARALGVTAAYLETGREEAREPDAPWKAAGPLTQPPSLAAALPIVLDAIAAARDRTALSVALTALVQDDSPLYRQRVAELLAPSDKGRAAA